MDRKITKKEQILEAALMLFSEKGYDATSIDEIGEALNLKGPALYHYFKGKEALLDSLLEQNGERYLEFFGAVDRIREYPQTLDEFIEMSMKRLEFTLHDPQVKRLRKMMTMEQYRNDKIRELATKQFLTSLEELNAVYIGKLIEYGQIKPYDAHLLAFEFMTPVSAMIQLVDREPEKEELAMERVRMHMQLFVQVYGTGK